MTSAPINAGWHRIADHHGVRVVWVEPRRPREGWVACWPSRQAADRGNLLDALLLRTDAFERAVVECASTERDGRDDHRSQPPGGASSLYGV